MPNSIRKDGQPRKNARTWTRVVQVRLDSAEYEALRRVRFDFGSGPPLSAAACCRALIRRHLLSSPIVQDLPLMEVFK